MYSGSKNRGATGQSFIISLILHGAILLVLGAYIAYTQSPPVKEWVASTFLKAQKDYSQTYHTNGTACTYRGCAGCTTCNHFCGRESAQGYYFYCSGIQCCSYQA